VGISFPFAKEEKAFFLNTIMRNKNNAIIKIKVHLNLIIIITKEKNNTNIEPAINETKNQITIYSPDLNQAGFGCHRTCIRPVLVVCVTGLVPGRPLEN